MFNSHIRCHKNFLTNENRMLPLLNENGVFFDYLSRHLLPLSLVYSTGRLVYGMDDQRNRV